MDKNMTFDTICASAAAVKVRFRSPSTKLQEVIPTFWQKN